MTKKNLAPTPSIAQFLKLATLCGGALLPTVSHAQPAPEAATPAPAITPSAAGVPAINVKDAEIATILKVFSRRLKRNYILDERVRGKVTMFLPGEVTTEDSQRILDTVLALKGFTTVPVGENLWKVLPSREAKQSTVPTISAEGTTSSTDGAVVTKLVRLQYMTAADVQPVLSSLISADGIVTAYGGTNSLIIIDYATNVRRLAALIKTLDIPFYDQDMTMIPVKHAEAADVAEKLKILLLEEESGSGAGQGEFDPNRLALRRPTGATASIPGSPPGQPAMMGGSASAKRSRAPKILADERTNSIIVVADDDTTARIKALVSELDSVVDKSTTRFFVYRCQHANAEELAEVLGGLTGAGGGSTGGANGSANQSAFGGGGNAGGGLSGRAGQSDRTNSRLGQTRRQPGQPRTPTQGGGVGSVQLSENLSITADSATNSLIINGSKADYEKIKDLLASLDIKRRQVLVEAVILEVGVDGSASYGTDWLTSTGGADGGVLAQSNFGGASGLAGLISNPTGISGFSVAAASAGSISLPGGVKIPSQAVIVNAARSNSNVNVLSSPTLLATDNQQAEIVVGQNVPFLASTSSNDVNLNNTFNQIDRQDVGITLRITPQISSNDLVTLQIFTDVSAVVESADSSLGPTTTVRSSDTTVITKDNQMVVIGGLMADEANDSESGVPFFKDIPVFGSLFGRDTERLRRTNLLTFITPRIIKDQFDARDSTIDRRDSVEKSIVEGAHTPDRSEVLRSEKIDNVAELSPAEKGEPGTITGPPPSEALPAKLEKPATQATTSNQNIPKLPELGNTAESLGSIYNKDSTASPVQSAAPFIVMRADVLESGASLPFTLSDKMLFGIELPADGNKAIPEFFADEGRYRFGGDQGGIGASIVGRFTSKGLANQAHGLKSSQWHRLSPLESLNLGNGPWTKGSPDE